MRPRLEPKEIVATVLALLFAAPVLAAGSRFRDRLPPADATASTALLSTTSPALLAVPKGPRVDPAEGERIVAVVPAVLVTTPAAAPARSEDVRATPALSSEERSYDIVADRAEQMIRLLGERARASTGRVPNESERARLLERAKEITAPYEAARLSRDTYREWFAAVVRRTRDALVAEFEPYVTGADLEDVLGVWPTLRATR